RGGRSARSQPWRRRTDAWRTVTNIIKSDPQGSEGASASLGCDLIRSSNCHPDLTPGTTDAQIEPGPQKRVDHCWGADRSGSGRQSLGTFFARPGHPRALRGPENVRL